MTRILLAVDGSKHSQNATKELIKMRSEWRTPPEIIPVFVHLPVPPIHGLISVIGKPAIKRYYEEEGADALAPCVKLLQKAGIEVIPRVLVGSVAETIVAYAKKGKCDFICLGTRGMTAAANLVMGSIATKILHLAEGPVILFR